MPTIAMPTVGSATGLAVVVTREMAIGLALGMSIRALVAAAELAGQLAGFQMGLSYAATVDPQSGVRNNLLSMFMQSTTMDYAGEATQDQLGLGTYDFAAARMFYGDVVSVFKDDDKKVGSTVAFGALSKMDSFGGILGFQPAIGDGQGGTTNIHYSALQKEYGLIRGCTDVDVSKFKPQPGASAAEAGKRLREWRRLMDDVVRKK